jgi:hypothetical protein
MAVLLLVYAFAMAYATFLENDYGTPTAKALIYEAKWFELIMVLLILNFIGNIGRYRLWKRENGRFWFFTLPLYSFSSVVQSQDTSVLKDNAHQRRRTSNEIVTDKNFLKIQIEEKGDVLNYQDIPYLMSPLHKDLQATYDFHGKEVKVVAKEYIQRKKTVLVADPNGAEYLHLVSTGKPEDRIFSNREKQNQSTELW